MNIDELLGLDQSNPEHVLAELLVEEAEQLLDDLVAERKKRGFSRGDVARIACISEKTIESLEFGDRNADLRTLRRYALAVNVMLKFSVLPVATPYRRPVDGILAKSPGRNFNSSPEQDRNAVYALALARVPRG